jgi:hypothetical protein
MNKQVKQIKTAKGLTVQLSDYGTRIDAEMMAQFSAMPTQEQIKDMANALPKLNANHAWQINPHSSNDYGWGIPKFYLSATTVKAA